MTLVLEFRPRERAVIDTGCVDQLCRRMGTREAEGFVIERVEEISDRLADIEWQQRQRDFEQVHRSAQRVARLCGDIGLISLGRATRDLAQVAQCNDPAAFAAVWERVVRIGDRSLAQVWEVPSLSL